jgi:hypothetical protein
MPTQKDTFYAVEIPRALRPGRSRLANEYGPGPALYVWRQLAVNYKRKLLKQGFKRARVVQVAALFRWLLALAMFEVGSSMFDVRCSASDLPPLPPLPRTYKHATITQGDGAKALLSLKALPSPVWTNHLAITCDRPSNCPTNQIWQFEFCPRLGAAWTVIAVTNTTSIRYHTTNRAGYFRVGTFYQ